MLETRFAHSHAPIRPPPRVATPPELEKCRWPSPRSNLLLAALPPREYERLLPDLQPVELPRGWVMHNSGDCERHLYFVTDGIVSKSQTLRDGTSAEYALIGREGVVGIATFLGGGSTPGQATVLLAGHGFRMRTDRLQHELGRGGALPELMMRYTRALMVQTAQVALCNRYHALDQRLCRWLLSCVDRLSSKDLPMTQGVAAEALGVRREGITEAAGNLQDAGLIERARGHWSVLDRRGLEARVCECYAILKREAGCLLPRHRHAGAGRVQ